jgi:hypothetical protein
MSSGSDPGRTCLHCSHFDDDPGHFEAEFPGITILSSGYGDSKGTTGLCRALGRLVQPGDSCDEFERRLPRP